MRREGEGEKIRSRATVVKLLQLDSVSTGLRDNCTVVAENLPIASWATHELPTELHDVRLSFM